MVFSPTATGTSGSGGQYSARSTSVSMFVIHHAATASLSGVLSMMSSGSREVSANYVVKDNQIIGVVPEEYRSWSLSSALYDSKAITVETCNSATGDASGWPISDESYASLAKLVADASTRYGFPIDRDHVVGHREIYTRFGASYATACPGGIDLDRVVREARAIQSGQTADSTQEDEDMLSFVQIIGASPIWGVWPGGVWKIGSQAALDTWLKIRRMSPADIIRVTPQEFQAVATEINWITTSGDDGEYRELLAEIRKLQ